MSSVVSLRCVSLVAIAIAIGLSGTRSLGADENAPPVVVEPDEKVAMSSRMMAAIVVAYEDLVAFAAREGMGISPTTFPDEYGSVSCVKSGRHYEINFDNTSPATTFGGGMSYLVDVKTLRVEQRQQQR